MAGSKPAYVAGSTREGRSCHSIMHIHMVVGGIASCESPSDQANEVSDDGEYHEDVSGRESAAIDAIRCMESSETNVRIGTMNIFDPLVIAGINA